jgi:hypothetical protein
VRVFRKPKPLTPRVDVKPITTYPAASIIDKEGNRRDF